MPPSPKRPRIAISAAQDTAGQYTKSAHAMAELVAKNGGEPVLLDHAPWVEGHRTDPASDPRNLRHFDALVLMGNDYDIDPVEYGAAREPFTKSELLADAANPARDAHAIAIARARRDYETVSVKLAHRASVPVLGICGGMQRMNVALGGTLNQPVDGHDQLASDVPLNHETATSDLTILPGTRLREVAEGRGHLMLPMLQPLWYKSKQIAANSIHHQTVAQLADAFRVSARAEDAVAGPIVKAIESKNMGFWYAVGIQWHPEFLPDHDFTRGMMRAFVDKARTQHKARGHQTADLYTSMVLDEACNKKLENASLGSAEL